MPDWVPPAVEIATPIVATAALFLAIWNTWRAHPRLTIIFRGALEPSAWAAGRFSTNATMEIYNPGTEAILVNAAGFDFRDGTNITIGYFADGTSSSQVLPHRLRGQESFDASVDALLLGQSQLHNNPATHAWVRRAGGKVTRKRLPKHWFDRYGEEAARRQTLG